MMKILSLLLFSSFLFQIITYEISAPVAKHFLGTPLSHGMSRERVERQRELCLDEYQQYARIYPRRSSISVSCAQYCNETSECHEQAACINPNWPNRLIRYVRKIDRMCYIRITKVLSYHQAEEFCRQYDSQMVVIDNLDLLNQLRALDMFNVTCKGVCPTANGYYVGLKRLRNGSTIVPSTWIWSNNETWIENDTCNETMAHVHFQCYTNKNGKKIVAWNRGEPNNGGSSISSFFAEECVEIIVDRERNSNPDHVGHLNDIPCHKPTLGVICQRKDTKPVNETRLKSFATIIGFNTSIEEEKDDPLANLFSNFNGTIEANVDALAQMAAALEELLVLPSFTPNQATNVLNVVDQLVDVTGDVVTEENVLKPVTNKLLNFLDRFPTKIQSDTNDSMFFEYANLNLSVVNIRSEVLEDEWFTIPSLLNDSSVIIEISQRVLNKRFNDSEQYRIIQTIFSNFNLFPQLNQTQYGQPISYQISNYSEIFSTEDLIRFQIRLLPEQMKENLSCAYWSFEENNGSWIVDQGCRFLGYRQDYAQCICNHLTHFALLIVIESILPVEPLTKIEELVLTSVTYVGLAVSVLGLLLTLITFAMFRRLQRNNLHKSLMMLCVSIFIVDLLYIPFHLNKPGSYPSDLLCTLFGFLFHYFFLSSFMWMFIISIVQYFHFVRVFNSHVSFFFVKTAFIAWILPLVFPSIVLLADYDRAYLGNGRCWIENGYLLYGTFAFPIVLILISNSILFGLILKSICRHNTTIANQEKNQSKLQLGAALCCFVCMGCTWFFGLLVLIQSNFIHQLIFCLSNSFQGFFIFLFHIYLSKAKRELWRIFLLERGIRQRPTISSSQSRSGPMTSLVPPIKFRFTGATSSSSSHDYISTIVPVQIRINPSYS